MTASGNSELAALRRAFEAARGDVAKLRALNDSLRNHNSDEANALQLEVAWELTKARRAGAAPAQSPTNHTAPPNGDFLANFLRRRRLPAPTGAALFRYRVTDAEFSALSESLTQLHRRRHLDDPGPRAAAIYALYAAEWFRRHYEGRGLKWEDITPNIRLEYHSTIDLTRKGLGWWKRSPRRINGVEERLLSLALEGGFPTRVLDANTSGWLANYLRRVIIDLSAVLEPEVETAYQLATRASGALPISFRNTEMIGLCAELAIAIDGLKREASFAQAPGVVSSACLDIVRPTWRDDLPIRIEGEGARHLVDGLIDASSERTSGDGDARCHRLLVREGDGWVAAVQLKTDGWVFGVGDALDDNAGRLRVRPAGKLAELLVGEIALIEPPVEKGPWRARPKQRLEASLPFPFAEPVLVELLGGRATRTITWPKGEARRAEVYVFTDPRGEDAPDAPRRLELVGSGSLKSRHPVLYALAPNSFQAVSDHHPPEVVWRGAARSLFRLSGPTRLGFPEHWWRVSPGELSDIAETLAINGDSPHGLDDSVRLITHPVQVRTRRGGQTSTPQTGEIFWKRPGDRNEYDLTRVRLPEGCVDVIWRDPLAGVMRDRTRLAILPSDTRVRGKPNGDGSATFRLDGLSGWQVTLAPESSARAEPVADGLRVAFPGQPKRQVTLRLAPRTGADIQLTTRFPMSDGGFARPNGSLFRPNQRLVLSDLHGALAFCEGSRRLTLELRATGATNIREVPFTDEIPLWTLSDDIARLASGADGVEDLVRVTIDPGGRRVDVGAYSVTISVTQGQINVEANPEVGGEGPFRLEWRSLCDISPEGRQVLREAATLDEITSQVHQQPCDVIGPGLIFLRSGDFVIGRPSVVGGLPPKPDALNSLQSAVLPRDELERNALIDAAFAEIRTGLGDGPRNLRFLHAFIDGLDGIPPTVCNVLARLPRHLAVAAVALVCAPGAALREKVWRLERDLCFLWPLVPVDAWAAAFRIAEAQARPPLVQAGFAAEAIEKLLALQLQTIADEILALDDILATPLCLAGVLPAEQTEPRAARDVAMDLIRRSIDAGPRRTAVCAFHDDSKIGPHLPQVVSSFDPSHRQGLSAPYVAALRAAGRITLTRQQIVLLRCALADDPVHFAEAYAIGLRQFTSVRPQGIS